MGWGRGAAGGMPTPGGRSPGSVKGGPARVPPAPSHVTQEGGSQDPVHVTPGAETLGVWRGGSRRPGSRDRGRGAGACGSARPRPQLRPLLLSSPRRSAPPGSGARRSHDLWGRGCRSEGAGEPGRSGNKGRGCGAGAAAASGPAGTPPASAGPDLPAGSGKDGEEAAGTRSPHPLPGLPPEPRCTRGRGADQQPPHPTAPAPPSRIPSAGARGCPRAGGARAPHLDAPLPARPSGPRADVGAWGRGRARGAPSTPGVLRAPLRGEGRIPTERFPRGAGGGAAGPSPPPV